MPRVTKIPATLTQYTAMPIAAPRRRRVAAYARVSTDHEDQQSSYEAQVDYYTNYIQSRSDWEFSGIYADEGITGTSIKHREGFKRMIQDALDGKIDLIVTKSVSRFARNTVDSLTTIRNLKEKGVECFFEKENIWTFDGKGELLITIMSSLAQEESRSISENCTWGQRKRMADGRVAVPFEHFLGYDRGEHGELVINEEQAKTVRLIYDLFLQGLTPHAIAKRLTEMGILTPRKKAVWNQCTVRSILTNEKYKGDALMQKRYTESFITKKQRVNNGELPQYYVEGNHEAIIPPETFELVQQEMTRRKAKNGRYSGVDIFASRLVCGECGACYGAKVWHSNSRYRRVIYRCNRKYALEIGRRVGLHLFIPVGQQLILPGDDVPGFDFAQHLFAKGGEELRPDHVFLAQPGVFLQPGPHVMLIQLQEGFKGHVRISIGLQLEVALPLLCFPPGGKAPFAFLPLHTLPVVVPDHHIPGAVLLILVR